MVLIFNKTNWSTAEMGGVQGPSDSEHTAETGTYRWMAPEVIRHESYSLQADVFSYALLAWQLLTREEPFCKLSQIESAGLVALEQARPPIPYGTPRQIAWFVNQCWKECPDERLTFDVIKAELKDMQKNLSDVENQFLEASFGHPVYEVTRTNSNFDRAHMPLSRSKSLAFSITENDLSIIDNSKSEKKKTGGGWGLFKKKISYR